jgi:hypothetical protein
MPVQTYSYLALQFLTGGGQLRNKLLNLARGTACKMVISLSIGETKAGKQNLSTQHFTEALH